MGIFVTARCLDSPFGRRKRTKIAKVWSNEGEKADATVDATAVRFLSELEEGGLKMEKIIGDGNCLFRAVARQVWGDENRHRDMRNLCCDYMRRRKIGRALVDSESKFIAYIEKIAQDGVWGDDPEIRAMEEMLDRPFEIYVAELEDGGKRPRKIHLQESFPQTVNELQPIRLSYHGKTHYNSIESKTSPVPLMPDWKEQESQLIYDWRTRTEAELDARNSVSLENSSVAGSAPSDVGDGSDDQLSVKPPGTGN